MVAVGGIGLAYLAAPLVVPMPPKMPAMLEIGLGGLFALIFGGDVLGKLR